VTEYIVDYSYVLPEWDSVRIDANDKTEAELTALEDIKRLNPEFDDIRIETVVEVPVHG